MSAGEGAEYFSRVARISAQTRGQGRQGKERAQKRKKLKQAAEWLGTGYTARRRAWGLAYAAKRGHGAGELDKLQSGLSPKCICDCFSTLIA